MSVSRPRRAAALHADWLTKEQHSIAHAVVDDHPQLGAFLDDDDAADPSYGPNKRQRSSAFSPLDDEAALLPLPPPVAFSSDSSLPSSDGFDVWDEDARDSRHQRTRMTGCYVIAPLYRVPPGYIDEQTATANASASPPPPLSSSSRVLLPSGLTSLSPSEPLSAVRARDAALSGALAALSSFFSSLMSSQHEATFASIHRWLSSIPDVADAWSLANVVPTALLYCGVDVDDHPLLFSELSSYLTSPDRRSSHVCLPLLLTAPACSSVDKAVQHVLLSLITLYPTSTTASTLSRRSQSSAHYLYGHQQQASRHKHLLKDLWSHFAAWWEATQSDHRGRPIRLLLMVADPHAFDAALLTSVLYVLMSHATLGRLPWCWTFGLGVDDRVMRGVGHRVMSRTKVASFRLAPSSSLLAPVKEALLTKAKSPLPLPLLSGETLAWLTTSYAAGHTSLAAWATVLRAIVCEYHREVEFSHMTQAWREGRGAQFVKDLSAEELRELRRVLGEDGVGGEVALEGRGRRRLTFSDDEYREKVTRWMSEFDEARDRVVVACTVLHALSTRLLPAKATREDVLLDAILHCSPSASAARSVESLPLVTSVLQALRSQPKSTVIAALRDMGSVLAEESSRTWAIDCAERIPQVIDALNAGEAAASRRVTTAGAPTIKAVKASNATSRRDAQLGGVVKAEKEREAVRSAVVGFVSALLSEQQLVPLASLPLSSLFVFHATTLPSMFGFDQQSAVRAAVMEPPQAPALSSSSSPSSSVAPLSSSMDDMTVVYRLYEEAGLSIDLHGCFQAFCSIFAPQPASVARREAKERGARRGGAERSAAEVADGDFVQSLDERLRLELFVRFTACINALRWCGFVKPANGKHAQDEMVKLVFEH